MLADLAVIALVIVISVATAALVVVLDGMFSELARSAPERTGDSAPGNR